MGSAAPEVPRRWRLGRRAAEPGTDGDVSAEPAHEPGSRMRRITCSTLPLSRSWPRKTGRWTWPWKSSPREPEPERELTLHWPVQGRAEPELWAASEVATTEDGAGTLSEGAVSVPEVQAEGGLVGGSRGDTESVQQKEWQSSEEPASVS